MRCTDCSKEVRPVVAIDIDGTLGDYHGHFLKFADQYLGHGRDGLLYDGSNPFSEWFCRAYGVDLRTFRDIKLSYRQGAQKRSMPLFDGADLFAQRIKDAGAEVWITTTRPYLRLDNIDPDTRHWLGSNMIDYEGLIYDEDKYRVLADQVTPERVVAVVDDLPEKLIEARDVFGGFVTCWWRNEYNRNAGRGGWTDYLELGSSIVERIQKWNEDHR